MQFSQLATLLSAAALAAATNTLTFISQDTIGRTIYFTSNPGAGEIADLVVAGGATVTIDVPATWQGNFYSVSDGEPNVPGMLGELAMNSWGGITFFDVSAIVNPNDKNGVKQIYPAGITTSGLTNTYTLVTSGCVEFPCPNAYYLPDDVETKASQISDLIVTLGTAANAVRSPEEHDTSSPVFAREWVMGKWTPYANHAN